MELSSEYMGPYNLGNPAEFDMWELASLVGDNFEYTIPVINKPLPIDDPKRRKPDITLINSLTGWQPKVSLKEGLIPTIKYFKQFKK